MKRQIGKILGNYSVEALTSIGQLFSFLATYLIALIMGFEVRGDITYFITLSSLIGIVVTFSIDKEIAISIILKQRECKNHLGCMLMKYLKLSPSFAVLGTLIAVLVIQTVNLTSVLQYGIYLFLIIVFELCQGYLIGSKRLNYAYFLRALQSFFFLISVILLEFVEISALYGLINALIISTLASVILAIKRLHLNVEKCSQSLHLNWSRLISFHLSFLCLITLTKLDLLFLKGRISDFQYGVYVICGTLGNLMVMATRGAIVRGLAGLSLKNGMREYAIPIITILILFTFSSEILRIMYGNLPSYSELLSRILLFCGFVGGVTQNLLFISFRSGQMSLFKVVMPLGVAIISYAFIQQFKPTNLLIWVAFIALSVQLTQYAVFLYSRRRS